MQDSYGHATISIHKFLIYALAPFLRTRSQLKRRYELSVYPWTQSSQFSRSTQAPPSDQCVSGSCELATAVLYRILARRPILYPQLKFVRFPSMRRWRRNLQFQARKVLTLGNYGRIIGTRIGLDPPLGHFNLTNRGHSGRNRLVRLGRREFYTAPLAPIYEPPLERILRRPGTENFPWP